MKQVPASEYNPTESIKTNILGSENVVHMAAECGVQRVIALSTDKAVNPINLYGATKLCAEKLFIAANAFVGRKKCKFSVVRYGNVVGSRGSVVPFFLKKRKEGVLPVTHPDMTRFWITLSHGVEFVLKSLEMMTGGETFVPKMPSMGILDLAGFIAPECPTQIVGIRPGEKIHETVISPDEARNTLDGGDYYLIKSDNPFFKSSVDENGFKPVAADFEYKSNTNHEWITKEQVEQMLSPFTGGA
jgi:UDP-N-acetylglucosamine 4,6-dehydratase